MPSGFLPRLDRRLALGLTVLGASGWLFGGVLLHDVATREGVALADPQLLGDVVARRVPGLDPVARAVTELGFGPLAYALLLVVGFLVWRRCHDWRRPLGAIAVLALGQLARFLIMEVVRRMRPPQELWLAQPDGFSFPSGHTTTATIGYGLIAWLLVRLFPARRTALLVAAGAVAVAVGLSRVYLGVHWPSDVLASWCLGVAWLAFASSVVLTWRLRASRPLRHSATGPSNPVER